MVCGVIQGGVKTMFTLTEKTGCVWCASHHSMLKMNTTSFLIALFTVILEPDMQVFFSKLHLCLTFLLGMNQMHVVVSVGAVFPIGAVA